MSTIVTQRPRLPSHLLNQIFGILNRIPYVRPGLLPLISKSIKTILFLLVLVNAPSFPFQWHIRVWWHAIKAYWKLYRKGREKYLDDWEKENLAAGQLKSFRTRMKRIAWVDDCDYNMHLSNSCYAKNSDPARMDWCIQALAPVWTPKIHAALAGSHYIFLKEIPIGSEYVMETRIIGWGEKWFYLVTEFLIYPKNTSSSKKTIENMEKKTGESQAIPTELKIPLTSAPSLNDTPDLSGTSTPVTNMEEAKKNALKNRKPREDGGVLACLAVFEYCFKAGRVTVPPRIGFYIGFQSPVKAERDHARSIILSKDKGMGWVKGGWKNEPNANDIGRNIGLEGNEGDDSWIDKGRRGMEDVAIGLGTI